MPTLLRPFPIVRSYPVQPSLNGLTRGHIACTARDARGNSHEVKLVAAHGGYVYVEFGTHTAYPRGLAATAHMLAFNCETSARWDAPMARFVIPLAAWEAAWALAGSPPPTPPAVALPLPAAA